jgi:hypothetical protein
VGDVAGDDDVIDFVGEETGAQRLGAPSHAGVPAQVKVGQMRQLLRPHDGRLTGLCEVPLSLA